MVAFENESPTGIAAFGLSFPSLVLPVEELAGLRDQDPEKYTIGLGCREMALCNQESGARGDGVVEMAVRAAQRALGRWDGGLGEIGLLAVGTESALDMSRPLSAWIADRLGLSGGVRSYEVKHACYGGTLALRQALEWKLSGASGSRAALVIATDIALYELEDPGEPTQGAGAVAMVVDTAEVAEVAAVSFPWSEPVFDFWRPVGEAHPRVDGKLSLDCYKRAAAFCFRDLVAAGASLDDFAAISFHVPFPKMVKKAFFHVGDELGWDGEKIARCFAEKVDPFLEWNRRTGNAYTASVWISVAQALAGMREGGRLAAFSYGSGFGAELLTLTAGPRAASGEWREDVERDFASRRVIDREQYLALRGAAKEGAVEIAAA